MMLDSILTPNRLPATTFSGQITLPVGSISAPSILYAGGASNSGLLLGATLSFYVGGTQYFQVSSGSAAVFVTQGLLYLGTNPRLVGRRTNTAGAIGPKICQEYELTADNVKLLAIYSDLGITLKAFTDKDGYYNVNGGVANTEGLLQTTTGINAKTAAATTIYTVPTGKTAIITKVIVRCTAADTCTVSASASVGANSASFDDYKAITDTTLTVANTCTFWSPSISNMPVYQAADTLKLNITTGATATSQTFAVDVFGYLI